MSLLLQQNMITLSWVVLWNNPGMSKQYVVASIWKVGWSVRSDLLSPFEGTWCQGDSCWSGGNVWWQCSRLWREMVQQTLILSNKPQWQNRVADHHSIRNDKLTCKSSICWLEYNLEKYLQQLSMLARIMNPHVSLLNLGSFMDTNFTKILCNVAVLRSGWVLEFISVSFRKPLSKIIFQICLLLEKIKIQLSCYHTTNAISPPILWQVSVGGVPYLPSPLYQSQETTLHSHRIHDRL